MHLINQKEAKFIFGGTDPNYGELGEQQGEAFGNFLLDLYAIAKETSWLWRG